MACDSYKRVAIIGRVDAIAGLDGDGLSRDHGGSLMDRCRLVTNTLKIWVEALVSVNGA